MQFRLLAVLCLLGSALGTVEVNAKRLFSKEQVELIIYCVPGVADPYSEVTYSEAENQIDACTKLIELSEEETNLKKHLAHFYFHRSRLHYIRMDFDKSLSDIETFKEIYGAEEGASDSLSLVYADIIRTLIADKNGNGLTALEIAKGLSEKWENVRPVQILNANLAAYAGQYEEAIKSEQRLLKYWANNKKAQLIASMYHNMGKGDLSQNTLLSWFSVGALNRGETKALFLYGKTLNDQKKYDLALNVIENATKFRRPLVSGGTEIVPAWEEIVFKNYPRIAVRRFRGDRYNNRLVNYKEEKAYALFHLGRGAEAMALLGDREVKCKSKRCMDVAVLKAEFEEDYEEVDRLTYARDNSKFSLSYSTQGKWDRTLVKSLDHLPRERIIYGPARLKAKTKISQLADGITRISVSTKKANDGRLLELALRRQIKAHAKKLDKNHYVITRTRFSTTYLKNNNSKKDKFKHNDFIAEVFYWNNAEDSPAINLTPWRIFSVN